MLVRLDLIEASKELGLPLQTIARHLDSLRTLSCTQVREDLRPLLADQLRQIQVKRDRLERLAERLAVADEGLARCPDSQEHCSSECALGARS